MGIRIAFALNNEGEFEKKHFGDADKISVHGTKKKADEIIKFLESKNVSVLVSRQFGQNIRFIVNHFIPVEVKEEAPEKVKTILLKHKRWLEDELINHPEKHKIFIMDSGILKTDIRNRPF